MKNVDLIEQLCELSKGALDIVHSVAAGAPNKLTRERLGDLAASLEDMIGSVGICEEPSTQAKDAEVYQYLSHFLTETPEGFDTVLGWLAKNNPEALMLMQDPIFDTRRDGFWLMHKAEQEGCKVKKVSAPPIMAEEGIPTVNAYPNALLERRLG